MEVYDRERIVKLYDSYSDEMKEDVDYCYVLDESYSDIEEEYGFCMNLIYFNSLCLQELVLRRKILMLLKE